jgi:hypothetical protein
MCEGKNAMKPDYYFSVNPFQAMKARLVDLTSFLEIVEKRQYILLVVADEDILNSLSFYGFY